MLVYVQFPLLAAFIAVALISTQSTRNAVLLETIVCTLALIAVTIAAVLIPWRRLPASWVTSIAIADILLIGFLREAALAENLGLNVLVLIPVLWLCYSFNGYAVAAALAGIAFVAVFPFIQSQYWPSTVMAWGNAALLPAVVAGVAIAVHVAAKSLLRQQRSLKQAYEELRVSVAKGEVGAEALRVSVAKGEVGAEALRVSVAKGEVGEEALRVSVAAGVANTEALRVSVAEGIVGEEALRVSVAEGVVGAEALRVSVAKGEVGDEALRVSVAEGIVGAEALRVSVAEGIVGEEALRVSIAKGAVGDEALRVSVAKGVADAEALRVSVAKGVVGAEALRVSVARALDAASAALAVVDTVDAGITLYNVEGVVLLTNDTARALAFSDADGAATDSATPVVFGADRLTPIPAIDQIVARAARGELVTRRAYWMGEGAEQRALMATSQFVRRASGELIGTVVATHDVTPLAAAIRSRDEFLTTVSHELRTPLTSVIGYLELIEDGIDVAGLGIASEFGIVQRNSHRLLGLINDLLTTAEGQAALERRPFNIAELVDNSVNAIRADAQTRQVAVLTPMILPVVAEVDADKIGDVLDKLLSNALKFNRPGGEISVTVEAVGDEAVVRIGDTGTGIAPGDLKRIFERFFRSSTVRAGEVAGSGLGLSTAKVIVDSHHGTMTVDSVVDVGTTIELRLPLTVAMTDAEPAMASPAAGWTLG
jgi:signal transduction histidine kinase